MEVEHEEFEGNIAISISDREVRLWVCNEFGNIFRFKAVGKVHKAGNNITILSNKRSTPTSEASAT